VVPARLLAGVEVLAALGAQIELDATVHLALGYLAGPDDVRAQAVVSALESPEVDIVWAARGGYGCVRLLPLLERAIGAAPTKPLVGFSDVTALLGARARAFGLAVHGPVVSQLSTVDSPSMQALLSALGAQTSASRELFAGQRWLSRGSAHGPLLGGNLTVLASLVGTPWAPSLAGAVVVLEDVGEVAYRVDRCVQQLLYGAGLAQCAALVLGTFSGVSAQEQTSIDAFFAELGRGLGVPVLAGAPVGHTDANAAFVLGTRVALEPGSLGVLAESA
jgi:muramoyltetrapeptide carboxypeptidase